MAGWLASRVCCTRVSPCLSVRSQPASGWLTVGLVDRSAERQDYGVERR